MSVDLGLTPNYEGWVAVSSQKDRQFV